MRFKRIICIFFVLLGCSGFSLEVLACENCTIPRLGREKGVVQSESLDKKWFFQYLYEQ